MTVMAEGSFRVEELTTFSDEREVVIYFTSPFFYFFGLQILVSGNTPPRSNRGG